MKLYEFSEESVKYALALETLGFDVVEVTGPQHIPGVGGIVSKMKVVAKGVYRICELPDNSFSEIEVGQSVSVLYIIHHEEINRILKSPPFSVSREENS